MVYDSGSRGSGSTLLWIFCLDTRQSPTELQGLHECGRLQPTTFGPESCNSGTGSGFLRFSVPRFGFGPAGSRLRRLRSG